MTELKTTDLDLDINNYKLTDLLNLFNINIHFTENDLKEVKKKILFMHPDKSGLDKSFFLFYSAAYKLLANIYNSNNKQNLKYNNDNNNVEYRVYNADDINNYSKDTKNVLENIIKKDSSKFNDWFNSQFEKNIKNNDDGYDDWLNSTPVEKHEDVDTLDEMHRKMSQHRKNITTLSKYDGFHDSIHSYGGAGTLITEQDSNFSSGLFGGNFQYDDLRKVYTETLIPVDVDNFNNPSTCNSNTVDNLINQRKKQNFAPISKEEGLKQLEKQQKDINTAFMQQNYELFRREEAAKKTNNDFLNSLKLLKNNIFK